MKATIKGLYAKYGHIIRFCLTGFINTAVDFAVFTLTQLIPVFSEAASQICGYSVGLVNSYFLNKRFTFRDNGRTNVKKVLSFIIINLVALAFSAVLIQLFVSNLAMNKYAAKLIVTALTMVYNYFAYKLVVFH